jgi:hypothetical protein
MSGLAVLDGGIRGALIGPAKRWCEYQHGQQTKKRNSFHDRLPGSERELRFLTSTLRGKRRM